MKAESSYFSNSAIWGMNWGLMQIDFDMKFFQNWKISCLQLSFKSKCKSKI